MSIHAESSQQLGKSSPALSPFDFLKEELDAVDHCIRQQALAFDPAVEPYVSYVLNNGGKRIRPVLTLLSGGATGGIHEDHHKMASILELIHIATLVHDDIIDGAEIRRQAPTANAKWGPALSVLLGDALFAHALTLAFEFDDASVSRSVSKAASDVCSGEIIQTRRRFDFLLSREDYFHIIRMKTAALFAAGTELGARLNGQPASVQASLRDFGFHLGTAYQVYDDCLDLVGDENAVGKTLRTDLNKGKLTLPILNLLARATERQREKLHRLFLQREPIDVSALANIADYEGSIESALDTGFGFVKKARECLGVLSGGPHADGLHHLCDLLDTLLRACREH